MFKCLELPLKFAGYDFFCFEMRFFVLKRVYYKNGEAVNLTSFLLDAILDFFIGASRDGLVIFKLLMLEVDFVSVRKVSLAKSDALITIFSF